MTAASDMTSWERGTAGAAFFSVLFADPDQSSVDFTAPAREILAEATPERLMQLATATQALTDLAWEMRREAMARKEQQGG